MIYSKERKRKWNKKYKEKNKEKIKKYGNEYYKKNKEIIKEKAKSYREKNKEKLKEKEKTYRNNNKDKIKLSAKKYSDNNKDKIKLYTKNFYNKNKEEIKEKAKIYRNKNSKTILKKRKIYREKNKEKFNKYSKEKRHSLKTEVFNNYPNKYGNCNCACCGIGYSEKINLLSIDHINNDGSKHRKEIGGGSGYLYNWLKKNNFPSGFRVLCFNCNKSHGTYGYCPHDKKNKISKFDLTQYKNQIRMNPDGTNNKLYSKIYRLKLKLEIIKEYEIDHIDGYIQEFNEYGRKINGEFLYLYLKRNNFPKEHYRLLCSNCNQHDGNFNKISFR